MSEEKLRIDDILEIIKKRWRPVVFTMLILTIVVAIMSFFIIPPKYEANTKVFIGKENSGDRNYNDNDVQMYQKLLKTYAEVIMTNDLIENSLKEKNIDLESEKILKSLIVTPRADTQILEIKYRNKDKVLARDVVDSITDEFIKTSKELIPNGTVKIVESVKIPKKSVSPNKKVNISIAFILGIIIGTGIAFLLEYLDNTFKDKEDLEKMLGLAVIGIIPNEDGIK